MSKIIKTTGLLVAFLSVNAFAVTEQAATLDSALIDEGRIAYWLKKRNQLNNDATKSQVNTAVEKYIENYRSKLTRTHRGDSENSRKSLSKIQRVSAINKVDENTLTNVNVLALLIDFPDLKYNSNGLSSSDTGMYYSDYSIGHYQEMLFSSTGFIGPSSQTLMSGAQYFKQESGGSFTFNGKVHGWYTAKNNAAFYGGNDDQDDDKNVPDLIIEAVQAAVDNEVDLSQYDLDNDGVIDHLLVFHSSIGEEAGGGNLGVDAIWAHRYSVHSTPVELTGSSIKVMGYTIQPIDSATGVVAHEFGHDLGLPDEYDTQNSDVGSPVEDWSIMSSGSWLGKIRGTEPNSYSPYARDYLQQKLGGKWINQLALDAKDLTQDGLEINLIEASAHSDAYNQLKVKLPAQIKEFKQPFSGLFQYHAKHVNNNVSKLSFSTTLPDAANLQLTMQAQWNIELDYDYVQIKINDTVLAQPGVTTSFINGDGDTISNVITGISPENQWQKLTFDLTTFSGQQINVEISYVTDPFEGGFGIVVDDLAISANGSTVFENNAESELVTLDGFAKIGSYLLLDSQHYYIQLRSHNGLDSSLSLSKYTPGVLMWLEDSNYFDNNVEDHPGHGFIAVIDADQEMIGQRSSAAQVRDAAFSLYAQSEYASDNNLDAISTFDDALDYSQPAQPMSGVKIVPWAIKMSVIEQADDSSTAKINLTRVIYPLEAKFHVAKDGKTLLFTSQSKSGTSITDYTWNFGDGSETSSLASPTHTYAEIGSYDVSLTIADVNGDTGTLMQSITVTTPLLLAFEQNGSFLNVSLTASVTGGEAPYQYQWDFGDKSGLAEGEITAHLYDNAGNYQVTLTVTDNYGSSETIIKTVNVTEPQAPKSSSGGGSMGLLMLVAAFGIGLRRKFVMS